MSELKAYLVYTPREGVVEGLWKSYSIRINGVEVYLKSEADKVIAELKADYKEACDRLQTANLIKDEQLAATRHHKYKRCLAMAMWCFEKSYSTTLVKYDEKSGLLRNFYDWWGKRWLELAEEPTWAKFLQLIHKEGA
jgi:hypothetical protein